MARGKIENTKGRGKKFSKDYQPDPANMGRPQNVFKQFHKLYECSKEDVTEVLTELISKSVEELEKIKNDKTTIALRACIASAIIKDRKTGSVYGVNYLVERLFGSVVQKIETGININTSDMKVADVLEKYGISKPKN